MNFCIGELTLKGLVSIGNRFTKYYTYCFIKKINPSFSPFKVTMLFAPISLSFASKQLNLFLIYAMF